VRRSTIRAAEREAPDLLGKDAPAWWRDLRAIQPGAHVDDVRVSVAEDLSALRAYLAVSRHRFASANDLRHLLLRLPHRHLHLLQCVRLGFRRGEAAAFTRRGLVLGEARPTRELRASMRSLRPTRDAWGPS
jgi:hypothetical protein